MKKFTLILMTCLSMNTWGYGEFENTKEKNERLALRFQRDMVSGLGSQLLVSALDNIFANVDRELGRRGHAIEAETIAEEYRTKFRGIFLTMKMGGFRDVGDHAAIQWLLSVHDRIEGIIGHLLCVQLGFHDLWSLAYAIPVVFSCVDQVDLVEYAKHFSLFCGIVAYWATDIACMIATSGTGVGIVCGLVASAVKRIVVNRVAPAIDDWAWGRACFRSAQAVAD